MQRMHLYAAAAAASLAIPAQAQDFGIMQSAETIEPGNYKLAGYPFFVFGEDGADDETGAVVRGGYGFTPTIDGELKAAFFDDVTYLGADAEFLLHDSAPLDVSLTLGANIGMADEPLSDSTTFDAALSGSHALTRRLELVGSIEAAFVELDDVPPGADDSLRPVHLVPGVEYRLTETVDLVAEYGFEGNDEGAGYGSIGLAVYFL